MEVDSFVIQPVRRARVMASFTVLEAGSITTP
jgi:hypothetical protein